MELLASQVEKLRLLDAEVESGDTGDGRHFAKIIDRDTGKERASAVHEVPYHAVERALAMAMNSRKPEPDPKPAKPGVDGTRKRICYTDLTDEELAKGKKRS
jgi:hypothetical protein